MALPRETIKGRIVQFGGHCNEDDGGGILVTKLFQLLSANTSSVPAQTPTTQQSQPQTTQQAQQQETHTSKAPSASSTVSARPSDVTPIMQPLIPIQPVQATAVPIPVQQQQHQAQTQIVTSISASLNHSFNQDMDEPVSVGVGGQIPTHGMLVHPSTNIGPGPSVGDSSACRSVNGTPPGDEMSSPHPTHPQGQGQGQGHHAHHKSALKRHQRQSSMESLTSVSSLQSVASAQSFQSPRAPLSPFPAQSHPMERTRSSESENDELNRAVSSVPEGHEEVNLEQLRVRQKELIKMKINSQREQLKQHSNSGLGRDNKMDTVAAELALVGKQIKGALAEGKREGLKQLSKDRQSRHKLIEAVPVPVQLPSVPVQSLPPVPVPVAVSVDTQSSVQGSHSRNTSNQSQPVSSNHSRSSSSSHSLSLSVGDLVMPLPHSSPLISSSAKDEFAAHLSSLPSSLDLPPLGAAEPVVFRSERARDRVLREQQQLEDEYRQYYSDQTEMLLLKLSKHRGNAGKRQQETLSTQQKLSQKQSKQRHKFQNIVNDQLQILQLTQELNEDGPVITAPVRDPAVPGQPGHVRGQSLQEFVQEMSRVSTERVHAFEEKQRAELSAFRGDLDHLNRLRMELRKRQEMQTIQAQQAQAQSVSMSPSPTRAMVSPRQSRQHSRQNSQHSQCGSERGAEQQSQQYADHRTFAFRVKSSEEDFHDDAPAPPNTSKASKERPAHFHSNSLPPIEGSTGSDTHSSHVTLKPTVSKFRVSESNVTTMPTTKK